MIEALGLIRGQQRRAQPEIVVGALGNRLRIDHRPNAVARVADLDRVQLAEFALLRQLDGDAEIGIAPLLLADLGHAAVLPHRLDESLPFGDGPRHGLLDVDVLLCLGGGDAVQGVPVFRRGNEHGIDVGTGQQVTEIVIVGAAAERGRGAAVRVGLFGHGLEGLSFLPDRVAGGDDLGLGHAQQQGRQLAGAVSRADHAQRNACAGRRMAVLAERRGWHDRRCRHGHAGDFQKAPPG